MALCYRLPDDGGGYGSVAPQATAFARERYGQKRFPHHLAIFGALALVTSLVFARITKPKRG